MTARDLEELNKSFDKFLQENKGNVVVEIDKFILSERRGLGYHAPRKTLVDISLAQDNIVDAALADEKASILGVAPVKAAKVESSVVTPTPKLAWNAVAFWTPTVEELLEFKKAQELIKKDLKKSKKREKREAQKHGIKR